VKLGPGSARPTLMWPGGCFPVAQSYSGCGPGRAGSVSRGKQSVHQTSSHDRADQDRMSQPLYAGKTHPHKQHCRYSDLLRRGPELLCNTTSPLMRQRGDRGTVRSLRFLPHGGANDKKPRTTSARLTESGPRRHSLIRRVAALGPFGGVDIRKSAIPTTQPATIRVAQ